MNNQENELVSFFKTITTTIDTNDNEIIKSTKLLAEIGWALPFDIPFSELNEIFSSLNFDTEKLNATLIKYYCKDSVFIFAEFDEVIRLLTIHNQSLYKQSRFNFEQGNYEICIPSLFSLIEGSLLHFTNGNRSTVRYNDGYIVELLRQQKYHFYVPLIHSISGLLNFYFMKSDFDGGEPLYVNRHWSQHGRFINAAPQKEDVIKLFLFLKIIIFTKSCLDDNQKLIDECSQRIKHVKEQFKINSELIQRLRPSV